MWHHRGGCVGVKLKTDGSMRRAVSDPATPTFAVFNVLGHRDIIVV
jgi:hypothetical protein